jgi:hypothetical protein
VALIFRDCRGADDDLSLVAGINARQRRALKEDRITSGRAFATREELPSSIE